ncbi:cytochrome P450 2G1-like [Macaca thibetana thibetana]|uniref:cytochrome P450 2G1-like n=1 Tax=Macaca thibetana thibetana TaxID=257877 RepID=UPI0021BC53DA|nr:cytochrome P450 2G1-like [Macaca thibetana thibetana]
MFISPGNHHPLKSYWPICGTPISPSSCVFLHSKLREKYGSLFTVYMGLWPVVVLCGHEAVKEALIDQTDEFNGHGEWTSIEQNFQGHGVALANGERWRILRRLSLTIFWDFRMGKRSIEERIQEEASYLLEEFRKTKGAPIDPTFLLSCSVSNVISSVVFGSRFDYEDKQFLNLLRLINESFTEMSTPWARCPRSHLSVLAPTPVN